MGITLSRRARRKRRTFRMFFRSLLIFLVLLCTAAVLLLSYTKMQGPPPLSISQTTVFYGDDDAVIGEQHHGERRYWIKLSDIAEPAVTATISIEDRRFYEHFGFDPHRIGGAIVANVKAGTKRQGASTITQQYARNLYLTHEKTWQRKWNELLYSLRLEMNYEKEDILEGYLNTVYYGHGAYGIEAASLHYFGKNARNLSLAEASMLAGIPKGPSYYSPLHDLNRAKERQSQVLQSMVATEDITQNEADQAFAEELKFVESKRDPEEIVGPYFQDAVEKELLERINIDQTLYEAGGLKIYTTLDQKMQEQAEQLVEAHMPEGDLQTSLVAIDPMTGEVKVLIGGKDYDESPYNRAIQGKRAPGSSFKPFLYYAALENGFTATTSLVSEATSFPYDDGRKSYSPKNYMDHYANDFITLLQAIAFSDNIFAVKTHLLLGPEKLVDVAKRTGIESPLRELPSLALGTMPVNMLEMVQAYSSFANGGKRITPHFVRKVVDVDGKVLYEAEPEFAQVLDEKLTFILTDLMTAMFDPSLNSYASVTGGSIAHLINRPVAGKSGSTSTDSWMIGYTPQLVTGVWTGYDQGKTLDNSTEGQLAKQIWAHFMKEAHEEKLKLPFDPPDGVVAVEINPQNGLLATADCPPSRLAYFIKGTEPMKPCPPKHVDKEERYEEKEIDEEKFLKRFFKWFTES